VIGVYRLFETALAELDRGAARCGSSRRRYGTRAISARSCAPGDAVGAGGLILVDDCADPFSVEAVRASMGALFTQQIAAAAWEEFLPWLRRGPGELVGTSLATELDYQEPRYGRPCFILVGNEQSGLPPAYAEQCDLLVKMPMLGKADSLNAAVATAVMTYEVVNQWRGTNKAG
jgi:TrmH family RNA methyltransferase